jgi:hypothetical protein
MGMTESHVEVHRILDEDLRRLSELGGPAVLPTAQMEAWVLPEEGKLTLSRHGLPDARVDDLMGIVGGFQKFAEPEVGNDGSRFYVLARYGTASIAAVENSGEVVAVPAASKVHPELSRLHPSGLSPSQINSSVAAFVECAWRWHWLLPLLADEQGRAGEAEIDAWRSTRQEDLPDAYMEYQNLCIEVLERFRIIDPEIQTDSGFWSETIIDVW